MTAECTDIRVHSLEEKTLTQLPDFTCGFCAAKEKKKLMVLIESFQKTLEQIRRSNSVTR